jgi:hypothetical protein
LATKRWRSCFVIDLLLVLCALVLWHYAFRSLVRPALASALVIALGILLRLSIMAPTLVIFEAITLVTLAALLHMWQRPPMQVALYALNPLVILYLGESAILISFIAAALLAIQARSPWIGFPLLGAAILSHGAAVLLLPFVITRKNWPFAALVALPLCLAPSRLPDPSQLGQPLLLLVLVVALIWLWLVQQDSRPRAYTLAWMWLVACQFPFDYTLGICLIFFLALAPSRGWYALILAPFLSPAAGVALAAIGAILLISDFHRIDQPWQPRYPRPRSLDIVIPIYNESANLAESLDALQAAIAHHQSQDPEPWEITVRLIDGGSSDDTWAVAERYPFAISASPQRGRGQQIAHGVNAGSGDLVLMLHADAHMVEVGLQSLADECRRQPTLSWGILGHKYPNMRWKMQLIEFSNRFRFHVYAMAFGDQGIFVRRDVLTAVGGVPEIPLMEDVELSLRLTGVPTRRSLGHNLEVSTRRWQRKRFTGYTVQVLRLVSSYLLERRLGRSCARIAERMYRIYYG